jgi:hypothetical protein
MATSLGLNTVYTAFHLLAIPSRLVRLSEVQSIRQIPCQTVPERYMASCELVVPVYRYTDTTDLFAFRSVRTRTVVGWVQAV